MGTFVPMTCAKASSAPISLVVRNPNPLLPLLELERTLVTWLFADPVTSLIPTQDSQTVLVTTLDSHLRLMDLTSGKMLNEFTGHSNTSYRCRGCFGHAEASVVCGDETGVVWAWDLLDVSILIFLSSCLITEPFTVTDLQFLIKGNTATAKPST